jgi:4-hydroxy-tetrahydrodipicolinate reductase
MIKVGVLGAFGAMGSETSRTVENNPDLALVARLGRDDSLDDLTASGTEVAVDFTTPAAVKANVRGCLERGIHVVVGTTGLSDADLTDVDEWCRKCGANALVAPNFAVGAVLMMLLAARAAPHFTTAEIVERHHSKKRDAPSGTSLRTAALMNDARREPWQVQESRESSEVARGTEVSGLRIHSLRIPGSVAHQEVVLGSPGETLTIRHDSLDRAAFMPGVILAVKRVAGIAGLTVGLEHLLDLGA